MANQFKTVMKGEPLPPRGFTPFQFSSRKIQVQTTQLGGLIPDNPVSSLLNEATTWYEMWINPEKVTLARAFQYKQQHTAGSIVTYHYRPNTIQMSVSGVVGWIALNPQESDPSIFNLLSTTASRTSQKNSPRVFMKRLREVAEDPMYFVGTDGIEHYNVKYIKIYTKQYPSGVICEGYFNKFDVPESGEDAQTINYSFEFTVESLKPITLLQKVTGMYGGTTGSLVGGSIRSIPGF